MLGERIRHFRLLKGLKQSELAEQLFISTSYVSALEIGKQLPSLPIVLKLFELLDCTPNDLFEYESKNGNKCDGCNCSNNDSTIAQTVEMLTELGPEEKYKVYNYTKDQLELFRCKSAN